MGVGRTETRKNLCRLASLLFVQFMLVVDDTVVNVALPTIQRELGFSQVSIVWVANSYFLFFGGFLLLGGRSADLFGARRILIAGLGLFGLASLLNGLAISPAMLVMARVLQGLGAAFVSPSALALVTTLHEDEQGRAKALGMWGAAGALGTVFGVVLSGLITNYLSWRWIFFINVPPTLFAAFIAWRRMPAKPALLQSGSFDMLGAALVTSGVLSLIYALIGAEQAGWASTQTLGLLGLALGLLGVFVWHERRAAHPLVPLQFLRERNTAAANVTGLLLTTTFFGMFFLLTFYMQRVLGFSPLQTGLAYLGFSAGTFMGVGISSQLVPRLGMKYVLAIGMAINALGMLFLSRLPVEGTYWVDVLPRMLVVGLGGSWSFVAVTVASVAKLEAKMSGIGSGMLNASQQVGGALGLSVLVSVATHYGGVLAAAGTPALAAQVQGQQVAFTVGAGFCVLAVVLALVFIDNLKPKPAAPGATLAQVAE
jgi:EmrB/QacA subfamily drug resistance transporter